MKKTELNLEAALKEVDSSKGICVKEEVKRILRALLNELPEEEKTYRIGEQFSFPGFSDKYILSRMCSPKGQSGMIYSLTNMNTGNCKSNSLHKESASETITHDEFKRIS